MKNMIQEKIEIMQQRLREAAVENEEQLEKFRLAFISKKSELSSLFGVLKSLTPKHRKQIGKQLNILKNTAQEKFKRFSEHLNKAQQNTYLHTVQDFTLPSVPHQIGTLHPITQVRKQMIQIFQRIGFGLSDGPEIEDDWHNFTALNFPTDHPAREMQDTFFVEKNPDIVLRTHTSSVQVRKLCSQRPPIRILSPGRVYRNETISSRANCIFHQVEGLYVDTNVSFADMKATLLYFAKEMFDKEIKIRLRPSYFPFTEPSAEMDISCFICNSKGCNVCKHTGWVEIMGCGMVDPKVLENCGVAPDTYTGFAFGVGIERIAMLRYRINDLRFFTQNDVRFLQQFAKIH